MGNHRKIDVFGSYMDLLGATWAIAKLKCVPMTSRARFFLDFEVVLGSHSAPKIKKMRLFFTLLF